MFHKLKIFLHTDIWGIITKSIVKIFLKKGQFRTNESTPFDQREPIVGNGIIVLPKDRSNTQIEEDFVNSENNINKDIAENNSNTILQEDFDQHAYSDGYKEEAFEELLEKIRSIKPAKHKGHWTKNRQILLLVVIDLFKKEEIANNKIFLTSSLEEKFEILSNQYRKSEETIRIENPFYYLGRSGFLKHKIFPGKEQDYEKIGSTFIHKSQLLQCIEFAYIDERFLRYFKEDGFRNQIEETVINCLEDLVEKDKLVFKQGPELLDSLDLPITVENNFNNEDSLTSIKNEAHVESSDQSIKETFTESIFTEISPNALEKGEVSVFETEKKEEIELSSAEKGDFDTNTFDITEQFNRPIFELTPSAFAKKNPQTLHKPRSKQMRFKYDLELIPEIKKEELSHFLEVIEHGELKNFGKIEVYKLEEYFLNVFQQYGMIGEIPLSQSNFNYLCKLIQKNYISHGKQKIESVPPAVFTISMVFCARYSEEEARKFWVPYADQVWKSEPSQYFQLKCRNYFRECRRFLTEKFQFSFPTINEGDVARPVYFQAEIPYYLQSTFASWLVSHFKEILEYSVSDLPDILLHSTSLEYAPKRLRDFIQKEETKETAALLIQQMAKAVKLFEETEQFETVNSVMSSPIQQSLWEEIFEQIKKSDLQEIKIRNYASKFYWNWDSTLEEFCLKLSKVVSQKNEKPNLLIWVDKEEKDLKYQKIIESIYPWKLSNGDWEIEPVALRKFGNFDGKVVILSDEFDLNNEIADQTAHIIFEREIPKFTNELVFFNAGTSSTFSRPTEKIENDGEWIIVAKEPFEVIKDNKILPFENQYVPEIFEQQEYKYVRKFSISLPVLVRTTTNSYGFDVPKSASVLQYSLIGENSIPGLSPKLPPIYISRNIRIKFQGRIDHNEFANIWLSMQKGQKFINSFSLSDLESQNQLLQNGDSFEIRLNVFLENPGSYSINILHDLHPLIEDPIEFSYLPSVTIEGPSPQEVYSPVKPVRVLINGIDSNFIKTYVEENTKVDCRNNETILSWKELKQSECRFSLEWEGNIIPFCWEINRVYAWVDGIGIKKEVREGDCSFVTIHVRGKANSPFVWSIDSNGKRRNTHLNIKGELDEPFEQSVLYDMVRDSDRAVTKVNVEIDNVSWNVFNFKQNVEIPIRSLIYSDGKLQIKFGAFSRLFGNYVVHIISKDHTRLPILVSEYESLPESIDKPIDLPVGKYQVEILLNSELVISSEIFESLDQSKISVSSKPSIDLLCKGHSISRKALFENLTISPSKIPQNISKEKYGEYIAPVQQILSNNDSSFWVTNLDISDAFVKLLPAWMVTNYPIRFLNKDFGIPFHIFPQQLAFGLKYGKGYMRAKIEDQPVNIYAAWKSSTSSSFVNLWLMFPQSENVRDFSQMDEFDMWPAYQCNRCGLIVGSRSGSYIKLPPAVVLQHKHFNEISIKDQFRDTVYGSHISGSMIQYKETTLLHNNPPQTILGISTLHDFQNGNARIIQGELPKPIIFENSSPYYCAISQVMENYQDNSKRNYIQQILGESDLFKKVFRYVNLNQWDVPAFAAAYRMLKEMKDQDAISALPKVILLLGVILRLKGFNPEEFTSFINETSISEHKLVELTFYSNVCCPKLLEWSIAFSDLFFIHAIS
jgi:hypothetical protein